MDRIKKTLKYIALSYKINFTGGSKILIWMIFLILPSLLELIGSEVYAGLIDSFTRTASDAKLRDCFLWLASVVVVRGGLQ